MIGEIDKAELKELCASRCHGEEHSQMNQPQERFTCANQSRVCQLRKNRKMLVREMRGEARSGHNVYPQMAMVPSGGGQSSVRS